MGSLDPKDTMASTKEVEEAAIGADNVTKEEVDSPGRYWSDAEEKKIKFKLDAVLLTCLMLGFFSLQLDKTNISSAITTGFTEELGISNNIVNNGNQLQFAAIVVFEIPSNMILSKIGAPRWLSFEAFAWGMIATFQAFITNKSSFYATRFLLGTFEAGYLAGSLVVIGSFYTKTEVAMRMTILYTSNYLAAGTSSLIAAGIFRLDGVAGLHDWQWLFLIDGIFTVFVAIAFLFFLPGKPQKTIPAIGIKALDMFNDRERDIMTQRIAQEDRSRATELQAVSIKDALRCLGTKYLIWCHSIIALASLVPKGGLLLYAPTIIKNLGFDTINANLLASVTHFALIVLALTAARVSDWLRVRGPVCLVCTIYALVLTGAQYALTSSNDKWAKYVVFVFFMAGNATFQGINSAWMSTNLRDPKAVCIGQAVIVMAANLGGLAGQQLFREDDAPKYTKGFVGIMGLFAATLVLLCAMSAFYFFKNRNLVRSYPSGESAETERECNEAKYQI